MTINILTICTGNVCRSPLAAQLLTSRLVPGAFEIASAGTSALVGDRMPEIARRIGIAMGAEGTNSHRATAITAEAVASADLVLGLGREHRREAAQLHPLAVRRVFTLIEFAHIVSHISLEQLTALVRPGNDPQRSALDVVMRMRGVVPRLTPAGRYDVEDPYGRSRQAYERSSKQIESAVDQIETFFRNVSAIAAAVPQERQL